MAGTTLARLNVIVGADISRLEKQLGKVTSSITRTGKALSDVGKKLTATVTLPIVGLGAAASKMASDAEEAANKFDVVFGGAAERVAGEIERLRNTIPAARHELQGMAAGVQDLLVPLGLSGEAAADMSVKILELAGDLASFNNLRVTDVLRDIRSGLVGQSEPLLKFGADTRAAAVQAKALELGLIQEGQALTNTARAMAVYNIVLDSNVAAQGDAARTAGSAANSFKFFVAEVKDLGVAFGRILLPVITPLVQQLSDLLARISALSPETKRFLVIAGGIAAALGPAAFVVGQLAFSAIQITVAFRAMIPVLAAATVATTRFTAALLANPYVLAATAIGAVAVSVFDLRRRISDAIKPTKAYAAAIRTVGKEAEITAAELLRIEPPDLGQRLQIDLVNAQQNVATLRAELERIDEQNRKRRQLDPSFIPQEPIQLVAALAEARKELAGAEKAMAAFKQRASEPTPVAPLNAVQEIIKTLDDELQAAAKNARLFGEGFDFVRVKAEAIESALGSLRDLGLKPTASTIVELQARLLELNPPVAAIEGSVKKLGENLVLARDAVRIFSKEVGSDARESFARAQGAIAQVSGGIADIVVNLATGRMAFHEFVQAAIADIARLIIQMLALKAISAALGIPLLGGGGGGGGGLIGGIFDLLFQRGGSVGGTSAVSIPSAASNIVNEGLTVRFDASNIPEPALMSPEAAAVSDWYRRLLSTGAVDARSRGVRFA